MSAFIPKRKSRKIFYQKYQENAECSLNLIYAAELVQDSALPDCSLDLTLLESPKSTNTARTSLQSDSPEYVIAETCVYSQNLECSEEESISSPLPHRANHFQFKEKDLEPPMLEIVSQQYLTRSPTINPDSSLSRMSQDCSVVDIEEEASNCTLLLSSDRFTAAGTMLNGCVFPQDTLPPPSIEKGYFWLDGPTALSSCNSRPPGQTKQEASLKKLGLLPKGDVLNPVILSGWLGIPPNWLDPSELKAATELLEDSDRQQEIYWTQESPQLPSAEFSISTVSPNSDRSGDLTVRDEESSTVYHLEFCSGCKRSLLDDGCGVCRWENTPSIFLQRRTQQDGGCNDLESLLGCIENSPSNDAEQLELPTSKSSPSNDAEQSDLHPSKSSPSKKSRNWGEGNGTIHWRTITKNGKNYPQAYYHWKENGKKRSKYIQSHLLESIQEAEAQKRPVIEILGLLGVMPVQISDTLLGCIGSSPSNDLQLGVPTSKSSPSNDLQLGVPTSKNSPSKIRRDKGLGTGSIQWKVITLNGKDYPQAWYHYEFWQDGDRLVKKSKYIPKKLLSQVEELEAQKAPVKEILELLGIKST